MALYPDAWMRVQLGRPAYSLKVDDLAAAEKALKNLPDDALFIYAKTPAQNTAAIHFLERVGFYLGDTSVTLEKPITTGQTLKGGCTVRFATPADREGAVRVAVNNFVYDRFHNDPNVSQEIADHLKGAWVENFFNGKRGDALVIAEIDGAVVGFNQLLYSADGTLTIDLIATDKSVRRRGVGHDLSVFAENECSGFTRYRVSTQITNTPSLRLYENLGFRMHAAQHVFHFWR